MLRRLGIVSCAMLIAFCGCAKAQPRAQSSPSPSHSATPVPMRLVTAECRTPGTDMHVLGWGYVDGW